ncbi:hypothetical protein [Pontibaca salina]|uniref:Uncharacterized protein n=1 Tax=Pontibaca salina TaxID=2795731 RepID=A0A934HJI4_9RHOB|nr:hypothetical protein [Pontibaca salina]MBI6629298.1 hypothetical protein [Pontibaca salina]
MTAPLADTPMIQTERLILCAAGPKDWSAGRMIKAAQRAQIMRRGAASSTLNCGAPHLGDAPCTVYPFPLPNQLNDGGIEDHP